MKEPVEPSKEDCCGSGCNPCIFDVYEKQLTLYKKYKEGEKVSKSLLENAISQLYYTNFFVKENVKLNDVHHLLILKAKSDDKKLIWNPGDHFLMKYTSGNYSCSRAYTPLKQRLQSGLEFSVIVKRYNKGTVSNYLCDLKPDQETLWRGPYGCYEIIPNKYERIIMLAQGTGVVPFLSIIENILSNEDDMTKLILLYCCQNKESILLREQLYSWKGYWNFKYTIFLSKGNDDDIYKYQEPIVNHTLCLRNLMELKPLTEKDQMLLCGSSQFMDFYNDFFKNMDVVDIIKF